MWPIQVYQHQMKDTRGSILLPFSLGPFACLLDLPSSVSRRFLFTVAVVR